MPWRSDRETLLVVLVFVSVPLVLSLQCVPEDGGWGLGGSEGQDVHNREGRGCPSGLKETGSDVEQRGQGVVDSCVEGVVRKENEGMVGIGEDEGEFAWQEWGRMQCLRGVQERLRGAFEPLFEKYRGGVALVDVALHANLGDNILWKGAVSLLASFGISPSLVCYLSQPGWMESIDGKARKCEEGEIIDAVKENGIVLFHAGGNWGDLYRTVQDQRLNLLKGLAVAALNLNFGIVQLPQSIYYSSKTYMLEDISAIGKIDPKVFHLFVRSTDSYSQAQKMYPHIDVKLVPDIAFALGPLLPSKRATHDVLILFRQDMEANDDIWSLTQWMELSFAAANLTYKCQDWWYQPEDHPNEISESAITVFPEVRLQAAVDLLSIGKVIITNRLHGSIVATMMGKHLIFVDTKEGKLAQVRDTALGSSHCSNANLHAQQSESLKSAMEMVIQMLRSKEKSFVYN